MAGNMIEVARATVTIIPNMDGAQKKISQGLTSAAGPAGTSAGNAAGESLGKSLLGVVSKVVTAAAIGKIFKDAIGAGAALQQSLGGVETLFRENADIVVKNAEKAYQTAGVSANDYMEQVTGFSATLLQGLGGDTKKAAKYADQAIVDMADNANKMGTSVEMIQNAYQGFAKDNYTMLDNLKLGYGGTAEEMARLINDTGVLGEGVEVTAKTVKDVPFNKIIDAIHKTQEQLGITGTTAKEATETFTGSMSAMKASWENLLADLTLGNEENLGKDLEALGKTFKTWFSDNFVPMVANLFKHLPKAIDFVFSVINPLIEQVRENSDQIMGTLGDILKSVITNTIEALPRLIKTGGTVIVDLVEMISDVLITAFNALSENMDEIVESLVNAIVDIFVAVIENLPDVIAALVDMAGAFVDAIMKIDWADVASRVGTAISNKFKENPIGTTMAIGAIGFIGLEKVFPSLLSGLGGQGFGVQGMGLTRTISLVAGIALAWKGIESSMATTSATDFGMQMCNALQTAVGGAGIGFAVGGPIGAAIGATIGLSISLAIQDFNLKTEAMYELKDTVFQIYDEALTEMEAKNQIAAETADRLREQLNSGTQSVVDNAAAQVREYMQASGMFADQEEWVAMISEATMTSMTGTYTSGMDAINEVVFSGGGRLVDDTDTTMTEMSNRAATGMKEFSDTVDSNMQTAAKNAKTKLGEIDTETGKKLKNVKSSADTQGSGFASSIESSFSTSYATTTRLMNALYKLVASKLQDIKNLFSSTYFNFAQNHIAVPHFTMSGSFDAKSGSVPSIGVSWYAKAAERGAIFRQPQIIGVGDASQPEVLLGEETLKQLTSGEINITINAKDQNVNELADAVGRRLAMELSQRRAALA